MTCCYLFSDNDNSTPWAPSAEITGKSEVGAWVIHISSAGFVWLVPGWESGCVCYTYLWHSAAGPLPTLHSSARPPAFGCCAASRLGPDLTRCICIHLLHASQNSTRHSTKLVNDWPSFLAFTSSLPSLTINPTIIGWWLQVGWDLIFSINIVIIRGQL